MNIDPKCKLFFFIIFSNYPKLIHLGFDQVERIIQAGFTNLII